MVAWAAMFGPAAAFLAPAGKAVTGMISTQVGKGGQGLLKYVESRLHRFDQENKAVMELVRSRIHVVIHLRPMLNPKPVEDAVAPQPSPSLFRRLFGSTDHHTSTSSKCTIRQDICSAWCAPKAATAQRLLPGMLESGQAALEGLDMGEGAERHELVLCKFQGYVCVDYKGMMYRMLSPEGKPIPAGAKAFRLNVLYDILRSAAQSGEYEVDSTRANGQATAQQAAGDEAEVPAEDAAAITPPPDSAASGNSEEVPAGKDSRDDLSTDLTLNSASGLSEAMAYTKRVMVRAEVLCLRGGDVLFASYFDTLFTREEMLSGILLHAGGKDDVDNPYCKFVNDQTTAILAQCEILYAADLSAVTATSGSATESPSPESTPESKSHSNSKIAGCFQSFSRIQDVASLAPAAVTSTLMPWLAKYSASMPALGAKK